MAKVTSRLSLNAGTEVTINLATRTIDVVVTGNVTSAAEGVSWQALYSFFAKLWESNTYNAYPFPFYTIDAMSGQFNIGFDGTRYNSWKFGGTLSSGTRLYLRDGGWNEYTPTAPGLDGTSVTGGISATFAGVVVLGTSSAGAQQYYQKDAAAVSSGASTDFPYPNAANVGVQVYGDTNNGNFSSTSVLNGFCRVFGQKYSSSTLKDTGKDTTGTGSYIVNLLLANSDDNDMPAETYANIITTPISPYNKMKINYFGGVGFIKNIDNSSITGLNNHFGVVINVDSHSGIDGAGTSGTPTFTTATGGMTAAYYNGGKLTIHNGAAAGIYNITSNVAGSITLASNLPAAASGASFTVTPASPVTASLKQIYAFTQAKLLSTASINSQSTTVIGKTAALLLNFTTYLNAGFYNIGTPASNPAGGGAGVCIEGVDPAYINTIQCYDNAGTPRLYPIVSAGTLNFSSNLVGPTGWYTLYYTQIGTADGVNDWGSGTATIVRDKDNNPIAGTSIGASSIPFSYDYTGQTEGGKRTGGTDMGVTLVAGRSGFAKPVVVFYAADKGITASKSISFTAIAETDRAFI